MVKSLTHFVNDAIIIIYRPIRLRNTQVYVLFVLISKQIGRVVFR